MHTRPAIDLSEEVFAETPFDEAARAAPDEAEEPEPPRSSRLRTKNWLPTKCRQPRRSRRDEEPAADAEAEEPDAPAADAEAEEPEASLQT